jgi:L-threonylcarbamoyladenylate synthase
LVGKIGIKEQRAESKEQREGGFASPGQLKSHYAPKTPLFAMEREEILRQVGEKGAVFLFFDEKTREEWLKERGREGAQAAIKVLSASGSVSEAASCLFEAMHELDRGGFRRIYAQFAPKQGLGEAINDRLRRASSYNN